MARETDDVYGKTIDRLEPNIAMIDRGTFYASAAISLKRIADALEKLTDCVSYGNDGIFPHIRTGDGG